jgi:TolA-binding protein
MKVRNVLKSALAALACFGTLIPQQSLNAAQSAPEATASKADADSQAKKVTDIELDQQGRLRGFLVDTNGKPEALKKVQIRQGKKLLAETKTDRNGEFQVSKLRGGVYQIVSKDQAAVVRVWSNGTAPPKSKDAVLLVTGKVARGQGFIPGGTVAGLLGLGVGITGLTIGIVNMQKNDDLQRDINRLERSLR